MAHIPVLLNEVLGALGPKSGEFIIDGTIGDGGHARAIVRQIAPNGTFLGIDWDKRAIERLEKDDRYGILRCGNYADIPKILEEENLGRANGVLIDLGFSSEQLMSGRGFSFTKDEPLLMTYSDDSIPAYQILSQLNKKELTEIIRDLSDEKYAERVAVAILERERKETIRTSGDLAEVVRSALPKNYERGRIDPATRTFQAIRMYVNDELGNLGRFLGNLKRILKPGGRAVVISFHSKEDRMVKNFFREMSKDGEANLITKKPIIASEEEVKKNPRSRSAKLRAIKIT